MRFLDVDPDTGLRAGSRWKEALRQANARCEAVICLLSPRWEASDECRVEYRTAENLNKQIFVARLEPSTGDRLTSEWQRCDLFGAGRSPKWRSVVGRRWCSPPRGCTGCVMRFGVPVSGPSRLSGRRRQILIVHPIGVGAVGAL